MDHAKHGLGWVRIKDRVHGSPVVRNTVAIQCRLPVVPMASGMHMLGLPDLRISDPVWFLLKK